MAEMLDVVWRYTFGIAAIAEMFLFIISLGSFLHPFPSSWCATCLTVTYTYWSRSGRLARQEKAALQGDGPSARSRGAWNIRDGLPLGFISCWPRDLGLTIGYWAAPFGGCTEIAALETFVALANMTHEKNATGRITACIDTGTGD